VITALVAVYVANSPDMIRAIFGNRILFYVLIFGELDW
jgi:hypothetical protein